VTLPEEFDTGLFVIFVFAKLGNWTEKNNIALAILNFFIIA